MKIWWQSSTPIHRLDDYRNALVAHLDGVKRGETQIRVSGVDEGSMDLHYNAVVAMNSFAPGGVLNKIIQAAQEGYNAVAIGCFLDPALQEAREVVAIPVFGLGETSMLAACMYGHKFSGCRVSLEAGAVLRSQGFRVRTVSAARALRQSRDRFQGSSERVRKPGADDRHVRARGKAPCSGRRRSHTRCVCDGERGHSPREDPAGRRRARARLQRSAAEGDRRHGRVERDRGLRHSQRLLYQRPPREALQDWMRIYQFRSARAK